MPHVVGIGGTTRAGSSTEKALRFTLRACEARGATTTCFAGEDLLGLPFYAPENPERTDVARRLVEELRRADAVILASSSYHGGISGLVKNAIDYTEDMSKDARAYFSGLPVGCIATGAGWQGVVYTLEALRGVVHALRGWATPMGGAINTTQPVFGPDGDVVDEKVRFALETIAAEVVEFCAQRS